MYLLPLLSVRDGLCTLVFVVLGHISTLFKWSLRVLQDVANTEGIAIQSALLTNLGTEGAQRLVVYSGVVDVFPLKHTA